MAVSSHGPRATIRPVPSGASSEDWFTTRWRCHCGAGFLWKVAPEWLETQGLKLSKAFQAGPTMFPGSPPGWALDVTGTPRFDCSRCGAAHATFPHLKERLLAGSATLWRAG